MLKEERDRAVASCFRQLLAFSQGPEVTESPSSSLSAQLCSSSSSQPFHQRSEHPKPSVTLRSPHKRPGPEPRKPSSSHKQRPNQTPHLALVATLTQAFLEWNADAQQTSGKGESQVCPVDVAVSSNTYLSPVPRFYVTTSTTQAVPNVMHES